MPTRVRQRDLVARSPTFIPTENWHRVSFIDLQAPDGRREPWAYEPMYVDGATLVALWSDDSLIPTVATWAPDETTLRLLERVQTQWPAAMSDLGVRASAIGLVEVRPFRLSLARQAMRSDTPEAAAARHEMDAGARAIGRDLCLPKV